jgi:hypothetical protein
MILRYLTLLFFCILFQLNAQDVPSGTIKGKIIDKANKQPLPGAIIIVKATQTAVSSDSVGMFILNKIPEGNQSLIISMISYQEKTLNDIRVVRNKTNYFEVEIEEANNTTLGEVEVTSLKYENSPLTPVSAFSFSREEISRNPGAQGDVFRAIGMLPGVSSSGGEYSAIAVRGQGTHDNVYMVDDIPITQIGHLEGNATTGLNDPNGGRYSIFAPRVVDNAQFQGGGFGAQYGRRSASYLGLGIKEGNKESTTIDGQIDLLGFTVNYDGPSHIFKNTGVFISARYQDFKQVLSLINMKQLGHPSYEDFIFKSVSDLNDKNKLSLIAIVSPEKFVRDLTNVKEDKNLNDLSLINATTNKTILGINLRTLIGKSSYWKNIAYYTKSKSNASEGFSYPKTDSAGNLLSNNIPYQNNVQNINYTEQELGCRSIFTSTFKNNSRVTGGIDLAVVQLNNQTQINAPDTSYVFNSNNYRPNPNQYYTVAYPQFYNQNIQKRAFNASAYADYSFLVLKKITFNVGARFDYTGFSDQYMVSPRISGNYQLNEKNSINFAAGIYYQDPVYLNVTQQPDGHKIQNQKLTEAILGYKKYFRPDLKLVVEAWCKQFDKVAVYATNGSPLMTNTGNGLAYGADISFTKRLTKKIHGMVSYSYMQSTRNDNNGLGQYNFMFSQPNQFNFLLSYKADKHWILSTKFRYADGKPTSTYAIHYNVLNDLNHVRYSEEMLGNQQTRLPNFISWDIRINYTFQIKRLFLTAFVDVTDVLNRQIANGVQFNPITGKTSYDGIAIFPTGGLKFEF